MRVAPHSTRPQSTRRLARRLAMAVVIQVILVFSVGTAHSGPETLGRWLGDSTWSMGDAAVHMALLRAANDSSKVLWFVGHTGGSDHRIKLWNYQPGSAF